MKKLITVAVNDFRLVFRDNSLKIFILLPLLILLVVRYGLPYVADVYTVLNAYIAFILMLATLQGSIAFGFIYSMVLVDEKDTNVAKVYGILPVSKFWFVVLRLVPAFVLTTAATFFLLLVEPFYGLPLTENLAYSILVGLMSPVMALFVAIRAGNKIEAMTWQKLFNVPLFLPLLAFYTPAPVSFLFAIFPTYWAYSGLAAMIDGQGYWTYLTVGLVYVCVLLALLVERFTHQHFR